MQIAQILQKNVLLSKFSDNQLKVVSDSISECLFCKYFLGACPQTPWKACANTRIQHLCLMTMQFQKWPTKFGFDWPFRPSNNFSLYCTLLQYAYNLSVDCMMLMKVSSWFASIYVLMNIEAMSNMASINFTMRIVSFILKFIS